MKKLCIVFAVLCVALLCVANGAYAQTDLTWDEASSTIITLADGSITVSDAGASVQGGTVTIDRAGTYVLRGSLTDGQIHIAAGKNDTVRLVLDGVTIGNSQSAPIYASGADVLIVILADGSVNTLSDGSTYTYEEGQDEPDAALFCKNDMVVGGGGSLTVYGNYRNGIGAKDDLTIEGGTLTISAVNDGLRGRDGVTITGGTLQIIAGNDGIKANNTDADKGWIEIHGGTIGITAGADGIQAESTLLVTGGDIQIVTGGGAANAPARTAEQMLGGRGGDWAATGEATDDEATSMKGLKAGAGLTIQGGSIHIDSADDSLHSNGTLTLAGGTLVLSTGDDGAHADGALAVDGGSIRIEQSYEGLEAMTVAINGGDVTITASDDGINAASGDDTAAGGGFARGGDSRCSLVITGGTLVVNAQGDALDSNGSLTISGGDVILHGPTASMNGTLDADGEMTITGGTLAAGGAQGTAELPGTASTQHTIALMLGSARGAGTVVTLEDAARDLLATYTAERSITSALFSLPALTAGETYLLRVDSGEGIAVTLDGVTAVVAEDGGAVQGGMGGGMMPGGGREGGGRRP